MKEDLWYDCSWWRLAISCHIHVVLSLLDVCQKNQLMILLKRFSAVDIQVSLSCTQQLSVFSWNKNLANPFKFNRLIIIIPQKETYYETPHSGTFLLIVKNFHFEGKTSPNAQHD